MILAADGWARNGQGFRFAGGAWPSGERRSRDRAEGAGLHLCL